MFNPGMDARQIANGIYRRSLIRPGSDHEDAGDFEIGSIDAGCASAEYLVEIFGHSPTDLALWLEDLLKVDPDLGKLVLGNDFARAAELDPAIVERPWPAKVSRERNFVPPFLAAVLYAELGRAAMNQAGLLGLATSGGKELKTASVLKLIPATNVERTPAMQRMAVNSRLQTFL